MSFSKSFAKVKAVEGGYSNNPNDSGGETNFGITVDVARAFGYHMSMRHMTLEIAREIYRKRYWDALNLDEVSYVSEKIADEIFDSAVNIGPGKVGQWFQRCLNVLNNRQAHYKDVTVDGHIGNMTLFAFRACMNKRKADGGEEVLFRMLNSLQGAHYITLAEGREKDEEFVFGWFNNRVR